MRLGYKLLAEAYGPKEIVAQAVAAEAAGFDFVEVSDHYHPWLYSHGHSGFVWSMLAAIAVRTEQLELATGVTCPTTRIHPAIVAQAAATTAILADGRFTLGVGSGERLNEHVVGGGWPSADIRHEQLTEALEIIRRLWSGGYHSYRGRHLALDDARVFDLPETPPQIVVAAGGARAATLAADHGDGLFATEPRSELVEAYRQSGGSGPRYGEVPLAWAPDEDTAVASAHEKFRFGVLGWKVQAELPNPINFEAAASWVRPEDMREAFACGPDVDRHVEVARGFVDAGFDHLALINAGPDVDGFFTFFTEELRPRLTELDV
ncbi:TIGR03557 family F420-dependent LLM class oxidoreductase [Rhodococcus triatomae]|uniref:TIGR03557 family F420-dependent LLM class oxidoreductase n=1 Tax=Rhodococcus triatomae TaxID=300028 RepID=UPI000933E9CF|nr:TIGR03557 family F420-dependent LLM class oxidoreductase [Rhodococcus triatomae]QNG21171.1 TIGR03557 family F420-dependent LLM class oxidoreductase [Rhodococcus triatomae]QNG25539.1 TIGR03557 family F420-dependent LLM class oxidoreductase [Rhodococcus triatomae]